MKSILNILIVDDHPMMVEAYKSIIESIGDYIIQFTTANDCKKGFEAITNKDILYDVALIDILLPQFEEKSILSGEDLALLIRNKIPSCKIMLLTSLSEIFKIQDLIDKINPNALLVKSDFTPNDLLNYLRLVLADQYCYSHTVQTGLQKLKKSALYLDSTNRQIISLLAKGVLTKNIPNYLNLSLSAIDKRKSFIKTFFDIENGNDEDIITKAKKFGLI